METLPISATRPSAYEQDALREIYLWRHPESNWASRAAKKVNGLSMRAADTLRQIPGVDWTIENVVGGLLNVTNEIVQDSVWRSAILSDFRAAGHTFVRGVSDIDQLDLEAVDEHLGGLRTKYRRLAAVEGAATGYAGLPGIVPDIVALVALNLRAVGEIATTTGVDIEQPEERLFALQLLDDSARPTDLAKQVALSPVIRTTKAVAVRQSIQAAEQFALVRAIKNAATALGVKLTRQKVLQALPVVGAGVGAAFNAHYTSNVCDAAHFTYRERFLVRKYGPNVMV